MRFAGLAIPRGSVITRAYVQFKVDEVNSETTTLSIRAQAADNTATFTSASNSISTRARTTVAVSWTPVPWTVVNEVTARQQTPELKTVIQEVVNCGGWASNNALVVIVTGTGERTARSYDGEPAGAPVLHVEFTPPPPVVANLALAQTPTLLPSLEWAVKVAPNPMTGRGALLMVAPRAEPVRMELFDTQGRLIRTLAAGETFTPGEHRFELGAGGTRLQPGVYFYRLQAPQRALKGRFVVLP